MYQPNDHIEKDNELADFTDRLLDGSIDRTASSSDEELLGLEKTILRLTDAFPPETLEDAKAKQMLVRLKARNRREEEELAAKPSFWKRLFNFQSNPQVGLLLAAVAIVVLVVISLPTVQPPGSAISGTAFSGTSVVTAVGLIGVLLIFYWMSRRK
jgi:membrane-bound ClpP family serine protease